MVSLEIFIASGDVKIAIENDHLLDFPSYKMVDLSIVFCKRLPEGNPCFMRIHQVVHGM